MDAALLADASSTLSRWIPILTIRYVECKDLQADNELKMSIRQAGKVEVLREETDIRLLPRDVRELLESSRGGTFTGITGPWGPLADQTGVCYIDVEVRRSATRVQIASRLIALDSAYFMTEDDEGNERGYWWMPGRAAEETVAVDEFGNALDAEHVPDLAALASRLWRPTTT